MDGEPRDRQARQHRHRLFVWRGRSIRRPALRGAHGHRSTRAVDAPRSGVGRRRGGANLDHAMAGLHADGDRSRRRLHDLVCWRLREEGRGELLDAHWRVSTAWMWIMKNLFIRLKADTTLPLIVVAALTGCSPGTPQQQFIDDAMRAIGGQSRVEAVKTLTLEGEGVNYNLGQDMKPEASGQQFAVTGYKRQIDIANGRQCIEQTRTPKFAYFQGPQPQTQIQGLDGAIAFNVNAQGQPARLAPLAETDRHHDLYHHPLKLLRSTLDPNTTVANVRSVGTTRQADITTAAGPTVTLTIDAAGEALSASSKAYHPNLGDVVMTTTFGDFQDVSGLRLPARFSTTVDDFRTAERSEEHTSELQSQSNRV